MIFGFEEESIFWMIIGLSLFVYASNKNSTAAVLAWWGAYIATLHDTKFILGILIIMIGFIPAIIVLAQCFVDWHTIRPFWFGEQTAKK